MAIEQTATTVADVWIVLLNYNGLTDTVKCLASLKNQDYERLTVLVVDNGSTEDELATIREEHPEVRTLANGANLGFAAGNNRGIELALTDGADFILLLNNDTVVADGLVSSLVAAWPRMERLGAIGAVINHMDEPDVVLTDGVRFNPQAGTDFFKRVVVPLDHSPPALVDVNIVNGCCIMVSADMCRKVGLMDEDLFIVHEEADWCLRAVRAGYRCAVLGRTLVWHKGSSSFERSGRAFQRYYAARNLFTVLMRHSGRVSQSRGRAGSLYDWLRYSYYRYTIEREAGKDEAATAVLHGIEDAFMRRSGLRRTHPRRPLTGVLRVVFNTVHRMS